MLVIKPAMQDLLKESKAECLSSTFLFPALTEKDKRQGRCGDSTDNAKIFHKAISNAGVRSEVIKMTEKGTVIKISEAS